MHRTLLFVSLSIFCWKIQAQSIYKNLNHNNFRSHTEFNELINPSDFKPELLNAAIFFATNEVRAKKNLSILTYHPKLEKAAGIHSEDMAKYSFFDHTNPKSKNHREPSDRAQAAGIKNPKIAENIVEGFILRYKSGENVIIKETGVFVDPKTNKRLPFNTYIELADQLMDMWMHSKGHRSNILSDKALQLGCGTALYFMHDYNEMPAVKATQNFQWFENVNSN